MKTELCIPAFNEERIIAEAVRAVREALREANAEAKITVVDNASTDRTAQEAERAGAAVLSVPFRGKGAAVVAAAERSTADIFGFIDADLSADPADIIPLLSAIETGRYDIAIGSRLLDTALVERGAFRTLGSRLFNLARRMILGIEVTDTQCGLKLMNARGRGILAGCTERGWFFDMEFLARAERAGLSVCEVSIRWREERFPNRDSKLKLARDGFAGLAAMFRIRRRIRTKI